MGKGFKGLPSILPVILSILIIGIAPFARKVLRTMYLIVNREAVSVLLKILFFLFVLFLIIFIILKRKIIKISFPLVLLLLMAIPFTLIFFKIKLPEEKIHLMEYALLGFLLFRDYFKKKLSFFAGLFFLSFVASFDELFHMVLPDRIFDIRDILFNFTGGLTGWSFANFIVFQRNKINNKINNRSIK